MDGDARREIVVAELDDTADDVERGHDRAASVVVVGDRIAEVREHAVPVEVRHVPAVAPDGDPGRVLVDPDEVPEVLQVDAPGDPRRVDEIAEHDREVPTLAL
jgi:hypothetical protein